MNASADRRDTQTVLFLCTGNYYRSRHAEAVFNHHATTRGLGWRATSRGLALERGVQNPGLIARATLSRLSALGIPHDPYLRLPQSVTEADFQDAQLVVALKETEHRPLVAERFPSWVEQVVYWGVHDVEFATPAEALPQIESQVLALIAQLDGTTVGPRLEELE